MADEASKSGPMLHICDKDGFSKGMMEARVGLKMGPGRVIVSVTPTTITIENKHGWHTRYRRQDGQLPSVPFYLCPKVDRIKAGCA